MGSSNETSCYGPRRLALAAAQLERREGARRARRRQARPARRPAARRAARRRRWRRGCASPRRRPTPAARSASPPPSPARRGSSRPTDAARAGASSPSLRRSTRPGRSRATVRDCAIMLRSMAGHDAEGFDLRRPPGARLRSGDRRLDQGPDDRHSARISARRHEPGDRSAVAARGRLAARGGREDRRRLAAQHAPRPARLLHRRAGGGLEQPRPLRRRALRPARSRAPTSSSSTRTPAPRVSAPRCAGG